jgi:pSer/pThr/pTyr-binding forkhead associated (FHA) protein
MGSRLRGNDVAKLFGGACNHTGQRTMAPAAIIAMPRPAEARQLMIVLQPVSHPELPPIEIHDSLFAIGRTEAPFDAYAPELVADLSRRHARIFCEHGAVYLADLGSKNGTTVNGAALKQAISVLHQGDQISLGNALSYRVQLEEGAVAPPRAARIASLTLTPEPGDPTLQPIVITEFPFMVSKADDTFARYKDANPQQVNYLSRRHAHIFLKGGQPWIEDLGSTNGTFVGGERLEEHAVALKDGDVLAFGGHHFVYRLSVQHEAVALDPTLTRIGKPAALDTVPSIDADKTTFVAAADSFLDIFCVEQAPAQDDTPDAAAGAAPELQDGEPTRPQGKAEVFVTGLIAAMGGKGTLDMRRALRWGIGVLGLVALVAWSLYRIGAPEREVEDLIASGAYARAAAVASVNLARDPANPALKSLGMAALLKANLPTWMALLNARQFDRAAGLVAAMKQQARHNPDLAPLLAELDWIIQLKAFVAGRGGAQVPIRDAADAAGIQRFLKQWEEQNEAFQRAFVTMSSIVPAYRDAYADALSDVRKLALARSPADNEPATP